MSEVLPQLKVLEGVPQPSTPARLQASFNSIDYQLTTDDESINHLDARAYDQNPFMEELKDMARMDEVIRQGKEMLYKVYTYRSCSKALPVTQQGGDEAQKKEVSMSLFNVLQPEIMKIRDFMVFCKQAEKVMTHNFSTLIKPAVHKQVMPEEIMFRLLQIIDQLSMLDHLKDVKTCLMNDFARYKRVFTHVRGDVAGAEEMNNNIVELQDFLGNPQHPYDYIMFSLKREVHKVANFEDVIAELLDFCMEALDAGRYFLPSEKHMLQRVAINLIYLLDGEDKKDNSAFKKSSKIKLEKLQAMYKNKPVLPAMFDMQVEIKAVLQRCVNYEPDKMEARWVKEDDRTRRAYDLRTHRYKITKEHNNFISKFAYMMNDIKSRYRGIDDSKTNIEFHENVFKVVLEGLRILGHWSSLVCSEFAYKRAYPIKNEEYLEKHGTSPPGKEYEKVTRYSYTDDNLYTLCDVTSMIKALSGLLCDNEYLLGPHIRKYVYYEVQNFVQAGLARPMRKAFKKSRNQILDVMEKMRIMLADWGDSKVDRDDYKQKKKDIIIKNEVREYQNKSVGPTMSQLILLRRMLFSICSDRAPGMQGTFFGGEDKKDLKKEWVDEWLDFYDKSFYFPYILNLKQCVKEVSNMSYLWFREFYLEVTKEVQFPITMSMPWIMTEYLVSTPLIAENLFFPLDIYNDVAEVALFHTKHKFIYDEVEAEVNLVFEQLVLLLANTIFAYSKEIASSIMIEKNYKLHMETLKGVNLTAFPAKYTAILSQRNVRILGRAVDMQALIGEHVNNFIRNNLEIAITRFECSDLSGIIELETLLNHIKLTHNLLAQHVQLDDF